MVGTSVVQRKKPSRSPSLVYGAVTLAIVLAIAAISITASRAGPPTIAEFAPEAIQQIKDTPKELSASGVGLGGEGSGETTTTTSTTTAVAGAGSTTTTTEPTAEQGRVKRCVGDPPRQTEDPQSPPCVAFWEGDNGGATYHNVTGDTISVAVPYGDRRVMDDLAAYFNKRYQTYGRKYVLNNGGGGASKCSGRRASVDYVDNELHAFAALSSNSGVAGPCFTAEMARRKLISISENSQFADSEMDALAPYLWQYSAGFDRQFQAAGEMVCARWAGKPANHSRDPNLVIQPKRTYGILLENQPRPDEISFQPLFDALAKCGESIDPKHVYRLTADNEAGGTAPGSGGATDPQAPTEAILQLKRDNVTTVFLFGLTLVEHQIATAAENAKYYPEWIAGSYGNNDKNQAIRAGIPYASQRQALVSLGLAYPNRPITMEPAWAAMREVDPTIRYPADLLEVQDFVLQYKAMLVLASGVQMAGPNLTPQTFEAALQRTKFPYPADDPTLSGNVSFKGDHSMTEGISEAYWMEGVPSPSGVQSDGSPGTFCYLDRVARRQLGSWPAGDPYFPTDGQCFNGPSG